MIAPGRKNLGARATVFVSIPGEPCAQGRPRFSTAGGFPRAYDPAKSKSWKGAAQVHMIAALRSEGIPSPAFPDGPLRVSVDAYFTRKKMPKRVGTERQYRPSRPDCDNLGKGTCDCANGILWTDDAQIVELIVRKFYAAEGDGPRVEVVVAALAAGERSKA